MSKHSTLYVAIIALLVVVVLFAYAVQRTNAPMRPATDRPLDMAPGST